QRERDDRFLISTSTAGAPPAQRVRSPAPNKTFIEAPQNVRNLRYLLLPIDETNGISAILGS
ncbi:hypothetical protein, partial [Mesorhizobium sp. M0208]|uniref:hypothetical protein n=1 Tax=Mesorhizobium sp. M0208 TaxID=2956916 RepID=UPI0033385099